MSRALAETVCFSPDWVLSITNCSHQSEPRTSVTLELSRTSIFLVALIWSSRYWDMVAESDVPRTIIVTWRANREKYMAA